MIVCEDRKFPNGFTLRVEEQQGVGDGTAANSIYTICSKIEHRCSKNGVWADLSKKCKHYEGDYLTWRRRHVLPKRGWSPTIDETGVKQHGIWVQRLDKMGSGNNTERKCVPMGNMVNVRKCQPEEFNCDWKPEIHHAILTAPYLLSNTTCKCSKLQFPSSRWKGWFQR